ncbi:MAG: hypothetical protein ACREP3_05095 [Candidatus Binatia bacterium]
MKLLVGMLVLLAATISAGVAATKDPQLPDREMLKMMELLRQMDMIKQMEILKDMQHLENGGAQPKTAAPQTTTPGKKKETVK